MTKDMTQGNILKNIVRFCLPLMVGNLFQQFYNMADTIIVGKFVGKTALSAVGSVGSLNFLIIGTVLGLCTGFAIPIARSFGAQDYKLLKKYVSNILYLSLIIGTVVTLASVFSTRALLKLLNTPDDIIEDAYRYIVVIFAGIGATMLYNLLASLIRALGDSKTPLYFLIFSSLLNIGLDLLLIIAFKMGVRGAAVATVISQAISGFLCLILIKKKFPLLNRDKDTRGFDKFCIKDLLKNGLPMALQFSITAVGSVMLSSCVNELGSDIIAAMTIGGKTQLIIVLPAETIGMTMATYCGQNIGAKKTKRIEKGVIQSILLGMGYAVIAFFLVRSLGSTIALLFIDKSETAVIALSQQFLNIGSYFYPALILIFIVRNALQGLGYSITAMTAGVFELVTRGIAGFGFVRRFGFDAACFANPAAWVSADILLIPAYCVALHNIKKRLGKEKADE